MNIYEVIRHPRITEKSTEIQERGEGRVMTLQVHKEASKHQIREAVERIFEVKVAKIRTTNYLGKVKRQGRYSGRRPSWKKAYVTLKPGEKPVEFFEGV